MHPLSLFGRSEGLFGKKRSSRPLPGRHRLRRRSPLRSEPDDLLRQEYLTFPSGRCPGRFQSGNLHPLEGHTPLPPHTQGRSPVPVHPEPCRQGRNGPHPGMLAGSPVPALGHSLFSQQKEAPRRRLPSVPLLLPGGTGKGCPLLCLHTRNLAFPSRSPCGILFTVPAHRNPCSPAVRESDRATHCRPGAGLFTKSKTRRNAVWPTSMIWIGRTRFPP